MGELPVVKVVVWQWAHPMVPNRVRPDLIAIAPPGVVGDGVGGARKRMKSLNFSMALVASIGFTASRLAASFATGATWQAAVSSRSDWNSSLDIPISTLYASPE